MSTPTIPLDQLDGRKIKVTWSKNGGDESQIPEGTVIAASAAGLLVKPRGATLAEIIASSEIIELDLLQDDKAKLIIRKLRIMKLAEVRQHLLDRHGMRLDEATHMTDFAALEYHNNLSHAGLGHAHEDKKNSPLMKALEDAEEDQV